MYDPVQIGPRNSNRDSNGKETVISLIGTVSAAPRALVRERESGFLRDASPDSPVRRFLFLLNLLKNDKNILTIVF